MVHKTAGWICGQKTKNRVLLVPILDGGLFFTTRLLQELLDMNVVCDYQSICITSYAGQKQGDIRLQKELTGVWDNHHVVLIDDIYDTGKTANYAIGHILEGHGVKKENMSAVFLVSRAHPPKTILGVNTRVGFDLRLDSWFVGCGMDLDGQYRAEKALWILNK